MDQLTPSQFRRFVGQVALGSLCVALITAVCFSLRLDFAIPSLLFLILVVLQSLWGSFGSSAIVSVIAVACLEYFFIPPVLEWQINDPQDGVALATYWATSLVITRLASKARGETRISEQRRRDVESLYEVASRLFSLGPEVAAGAQSLQIIREVFGLRAACLFDAALARLQEEGTSLCGLGLKTRDSSIVGKDHQDRRRDLYIRCLYTKGKIIGAIGFEGPFDHESIPLALSVLAATALERARSFRSASKAAADAQAEMLRSAILDAFAHEFKTPLAIILAAAGGLRETSGQQCEQTEMTDIIENQTLRLSQLTTRLLRIARLDKEEVIPTMERTGLNSLLTRLIDQCGNQFGHRISGNLGQQAVEVMADPELLSLAVTQLLDNACKYSFPESVVTVELDLNGESANVSVANHGASIRPEDEEKIFERFFRSPETEHVTPGTGLGLYVARKIVRAHGGLLELDLNRETDATTTFRIRLPIIQRERQHEQEADQSISGRR